MTRTSLSLGLLISAVLCAPTSGRASATASPASITPTFENARLGMSLQAWRALPFPGPTNGRVAPTCSDDPAAAPQGSSRGAAAKAQGSEVCAYVARYGPKTVLPQSFEWDKGVLAHTPEYYFSQGRLSKIEFKASIDAFDPVIARLKASYGAPDRILHGDLKTSLGLRPKVEEVWDTPSAVIDLTDPEANPTLLSVSLSARPGAASGVAGSRD